MTSINSHVLQCQVLYEQIPINGTDPHLLIRCIIVLHVNSTGHQPGHYCFCVRHRATKPYFNWSIGITAGRWNNWAPQDIVTTQDHWHYFWWNCWKWYILDSLEHSCVVLRKRYSHFLSTDFVPMCIFMIMLNNGIICHVIVIFFYLVYFIIVFESRVLLPFACLP